MGSCSSQTSLPTVVPSISKSIPMKHGTIGHDQDYEYDDCSRSRPNAPFITPTTLSYHSQRKQSEISMIKKPSLSDIDERKSDYESGEFAHVFVTNLDEKNTKHTKVAIKKIDISDNPKKCVERELKILQTLNNHNNIIKLIDCFYEICDYDLYLHFVMEFVPSTLYKEINKYGMLGQCIPFKLIQIYSYQILRALNYMNYIKHIIHRNLKPENILINPLTNCIKICDFGCSKYINNNNRLCIMNFYVCSRYYRAPELLIKSIHYKYEIDIWSFGCILSQLFLGNVLFKGIDTKDQMKKIIKILGLPTKNELIAMNDYYQYDQLINEYGDDGHHVIPNWKSVFIKVNNIPQIAVDLISNILKYNPKQRIHPFNAIMKHKYFIDLKYDKHNNQYPMPSAMFDLNDEEIKFGNKFKFK